jgi:hypothetical protein
MVAPHAFARLLGCLLVLMLCQDPKTVIAGETKPPCRSGADGREDPL